MVDNSTYTIYIHHYTHYLKQTEGLLEAFQHRQNKHLDMENIIDAKVRAFWLFTEPLPNTYHQLCKLFGRPSQK